MSFQSHPLSIGHLDRTDVRDVGIASSVTVRLPGSEPRFAHGIVIEEVKRVNRPSLFKVRIKSGSVRTMDGKEIDLHGELLTVAAYRLSLEKVAI